MAVPAITPPPLYETKAQLPNYTHTPSQRVVPLGALSSHPAVVDCPICKSSVTTRTSKKVGERAYVWGAVLCFLTGCLCWIPCVMDDCKDTRHQCPQCGRLMATASSKGGVQVDPAMVTVESQYQRRDEQMTVPPAQH